MEKSSRTEALAAGHTRYYTGKPCKYGHISPRQTANGVCVYCKQQVHRIRYANEAKKTKRIQVFAEQIATYANRKLQFDTNGNQIITRETK